MSVPIASLATNDEMEVQLPMADQLTELTTQQRDRLPAFVEE
jgi:hypothetical protein